MACRNRGHSRAADAQIHKCWRLRQQAHSTHAMLASDRCTHVRVPCLVLPLVDPSSPSVLDLTCSVYHISPRRACPGTADQPPRYSQATCGNAVCAAAISSFDTATLSLMKTGFTVSPRPQRVLAGACTRSKRVCRSLRERSGVLQGVQKGVWGALTRLAPPRAGLRCSARQRFAKDFWIFERRARLLDHLRARHRMLSPSKHREADAPDARHVRRRLRAICRFLHVSVCA